MLIPQVATIRIFQNLDHENLEATPRTLIIRVVDKADHGIALNQVHEQGRYAFLLLSKVFLIYAGEILVGIISMEDQYGRETGSLNLQSKLPISPC